MIKNSKFQFLQKQVDGRWGKKRKKIKEYRETEPSNVIMGSYSYCVIRNITKRLLTVNKKIFTIVNNERESINEDSSYLFLV